MIKEQNIITVLVGLLEAIEVDTEPVLQEVYDHIPAQVDAYPSAYVVPANWSEEYLDLRDTANQMQFTIGIIYTLDPDMKQGQIQLRSAVEKVRDVLKEQSNIDFNGTVDWSQLTTGTYTYDTRETKLAICEITLTVIKRYSRYETN